MRGKRHALRVLLEKYKLHNKPVPATLALLEHTKTGLHKNNVSSVHLDSTKINRHKRRAKLVNQESTKIKRNKRRAYLVQ